MAALSTEDRRRLITCLQSLPLFQSFRSRRQVLEAAGLGALIPQLELEGPTFVVVGELVTFLERYGRVSYQHESLGTFLNAVKEGVGPASDVTAVIDEILTRYDLMTPARTSDAPVAWRTATDLEQTAEKIIGENTLRPVFFLEQGWRVAGAVALVHAREWTGTGFMVSPTLLLTNHHVLPDPGYARRATFRFNYQLDASGADRAVWECAAREGGMFVTAPALDYTLVELEDAPGERWGVVSLAAGRVEKGERVNIIQHPAGLPKQVSFQNNYVEYSDARVVQYLTSTMHGSSGSPVFNDRWEVVALHHAGGMILEPGSSRAFFRNEGIAIRAVIDDLGPEARKALSPG